MMVLVVDGKLTLRQNLPRGSPMWDIGLHNCRVQLHPGAANQPQIGPVCFMLGAVGAEKATSIRNPSPLVAVPYGLNDP